MAKQLLFPELFGSATAPSPATALLASGAAPSLDLATAFERMARIRATEETLLELFSRGELAGTTHTSIGQEDVAVGVLAALDPARDRVWSNHRCHGHYLAFGGALEPFFAELLGRASGLCGGRGGSQHLHTENFRSSGVQGGIVPLACGEALAARLAGEERTLCVFLGDGTFGEGAVYESLNLAALWRLPVLFVVEDNGYAQTTPQALALAGTIAARFAAFGVPCTSLDAGDVLALHGAAEAEVRALRAGHGPRALHVRTYRLAPHSKGDDFRAPAELAHARANDTLARHAARLGAAQAEELVRRVRDDVARALHAARAGELARAPQLDQVLAPARPRTIALPPAQSRARGCERLNAALHAAFDADARTFLVGEDVLDPYGGAFKVAAGLSTRFPARVLTTPISEAALTGFAAGAALAGARPVAEIMFGDFTTLALDALVNHAAKLRWTFGGRARVPLVVRTPMGGRRGYGPTHSQSLERLFCGVPGLRVVCTSAAWDAADTLLTCLAQEDPVLLVENKSAYGKPELALPATHVRVAPPSPLGAITFVPRAGRADVTLAVHGGMDELALAALVELAAEEVVCELVCAQQISPIAPYLEAVAASARRTGRVVVCEEGGVAFGVGAELAARLAELPRAQRPEVVRVGAADAPIPAARTLEDAVLPGVGDLRAAVERLLLGETA